MNYCIGRQAKRCWQINSAKTSSTSNSVGSHLWAERMSTKEVKMKYLTTLVLLAFLNIAIAQVPQASTSIVENTETATIIVSVSHERNGGRSARAIFNLNGGEQKDGGRTLASQDIFIPGRGDFKGDYGKLVVIKLPEGTHELTSWAIFGYNGSEIRPQDRPRPLKFEIKAGEVKYLGNLHMNMQSNKNIFGARVIPVEGQPEIRDMRQRDITLFEARHPDAREKIIIDLLPLGHWGSGDPSN